MQLSEIAKKLRKELIISHNKYKLSHIGSELSCLDILVALYFSNIMKKEDHFILSKGHSAPALYAVLHEKGLLSDELYNSFGTEGSLLPGHPPIGIKPIEYASGSLGHGLSVGVGYALALKLDKKQGKVFVLLSDGELEEGSTLEAMNSAVRFKLDNLVAIIDHNGWQATDRIEDIQHVNASRSEFMAAGWYTLGIDGHDYHQLEISLSDAPMVKDVPTLIIADTVLGRGSKSMEDKLKYHYYSPSDEQTKEEIA